MTWQDASFLCTVRRNANFAHSAFQEVPRACLQLLGHSRCFWFVAARAGGGEKVERAARQNANFAHSAFREAPRACLQS